MLKFTNIHKQLEQPFVAFADFEALCVPQSQHHRWMEPSSIFGESVTGRPAVYHIKDLVLLLLLLLSLLLLLLLLLLEEANIMRLLRYSRSDTCANYKPMSL